MSDNEPIEQDPNGLAAHEPGAKLDDGKPWHYTALRGWYPIARKLILGDDPLAMAVRCMLRFDSPTAAVLRLSPADVVKACDVGSYGARKYSRYGWARVPDAKNRYREAFGRHVVAFYLRGETRDADGLEHAGCIAWNLLALASLESGELDINELTEPED